ncbi:hypothetical protein Aph01nite_63580 [Acrocarpospora phusangensis]|uniref:Uncharacterized protein n=1 Tax=Acrocarpospora phusangensis TaxID=1070424 RepID=A0A919QI55_9ACTN|nr:hypothetical protein Aph01nite_63580 [Acrocarpospora phusangensis]
MEDRIVRHLQTSSDRPLLTVRGTHRGMVRGTQDPYQPKHPFNRFSEAIPRPPPKPSFDAIRNVRPGCRRY